MSDRDVIRAYERMMALKQAELERLERTIAELKEEIFAMRKLAYERDDLLQLYKETIEQQERALRLLRMRDRVA